MFAEKAVARGGVARAGGFGEVLVEIAKEAGIPAAALGAFQFVGEVVDEFGFCVLGIAIANLLKEFDKVPGCVAR